MEIFALPYAFPHEYVFVTGCLVLILALLVFRWRIVQNRQLRKQRGAGESGSDKIEL